MNFSLCSDGLKLFNGENALFDDIKAYIMTEKDEKTYLEFKTSGEDYAQFALEELGASLCVSIEQAGNSSAIRIKASYKPENFFDKKHNIHFYDEHAAGILGLEPIFAGYGAVGATKSGCGEVPLAAEMYPYCYDGQPITHKSCDFVVINHGTNDRKNPEAFPQKYRELLEVIVKHNPDSKIVAMVPFIGAFREQIKSIVNDVNTDFGTDIFVVDASEWVPAEPVHPNRENHKIAGEKLAEILKQRYNL